VATDCQEGVLSVTYSNECFLEGKGSACLFCNINATKSTDSEAEGISWKYSRKIGEVLAAAAYKSGAPHHSIGDTIRLLWENNSIRKGVDIEYLIDRSYLNAINLSGD
jgi:hypothetical protein